MSEPIVSDKLIPIITDVGKQALFKKDIDGLKIQISHIALGSGRYTPTTEQTTLKKEELREVFLSSQIDKENYQITLNSIFRDKSKEFWVTEIGFFLEDGTLFAVWSHEQTALSYKSKFAEPIFALNLKLIDVNIDAIEIIDNGSDLKLNYLSEFTLFSKSFSFINTSIMRLYGLFSNREKENISFQISIANTITNQNITTIKSHIQTMKNIDSIQKLSMTNSHSITKIHKREVER